MAESQGERTGNSCLNSNAEVLRWSKLKEVMQKQYGEAAQAEELKLERMPVTIRNVSKAKQEQKNG